MAGDDEAKTAKSTAPSFAAATLISLTPRAVSRVLVNDTAFYHFNDGACILANEPPRDALG